MPLLPLVEGIILLFSSAGIFRCHSLLIFQFRFLTYHFNPPTLFHPEKNPPKNILNARADGQNKRAQPSNGIITAVPRACLTKTLTQPLAVYSFGLDNRMCSSIRPQITMCQNQKLYLSPFRPLPSASREVGAAFAALTLHLKDRWRAGGGRELREGREKEEK